MYGCQKTESQMIEMIPRILFNKKKQPDHSDCCLNLMRAGYAAPGSHFKEEKKRSRLLLVTILPEQIEHYLTLTLRLPYDHLPTT